MVNGRSTKSNSWIDSLDKTLAEVGYSSSVVSDIAKDFAVTSILWDVSESELSTVFGLLYYASIGESIPENLWHEEHAKKVAELNKKWLPWKSGLFGLGSICKVSGTTKEGKCVGIRSGRVSIKFPDQESAVILDPSLVEGKVE
jgi:hypothetical protein